MGHTSGKAFDHEGQHRIVSAALNVLVTATEPGTIVDLGERWGDDAWRANPLGGGRSQGGTSAGGGAADSRTARFDTPVYQSEEDRLLAVARLGEDVACRACAVFDG